MKETGLSSKQYQRLIEVTRDLASTLDLDTLLNRIIFLAAELSDSEAVSILLYEADKQQLRFEAATNAESNRIMLGMIVPTDSLAGWVAQNRQPVIVPDVHQDKRWFSNIEKKLDFPTRSIIAVPMVAKDKLIGVLEGINKRNGTFGDEDQEILLVLGAQAAVAIENTRLFKQSDLIAELVHELRTPLTSISTISYLLQRPEVSEAQRHSLAQTIHQESQRLNEMATSFLDLARLESGRSSYHMSAFDLAPLLSECCEMVRPRAAENGIEIHLEAAQPLPRLEADRDKVKQVILNLLSNAIKYNRPKGTIFVQAQSDGQGMHIAVQDSGPGMSKEDVAHLFERFFRASTIEKAVTGTGLGLSICKKIVDGHGGKISVDSTPGSGSTFTILLPLKPPV